MTNKDRNRANTQLSTLCSRYHDGLALDAIDAILIANGFSTLEPAIYCGRNGRNVESVGRNTYICLTWHKLEVTGQYEIVAYLS